MKVEDAARIAHQVNKGYCEAIGDNSQVDWEDAPDWQKNSAINGVKLHMSGDYGPEASHDSWALEKRSGGWVYGEIKDEAAKTHPCLVSFDELPVEQRANDYVFRAVVHALLRHITE